MSALHARPMPERGHFCPPPTTRALTVPAATPRHLRTPCYVRRTRMSALHARPMPERGHFCPPPTTRALTEPAATPRHSRTPGYVRRTRMSALHARAKNRDRCAGFSFSRRTRSATPTPAPQAGFARPSLATPAPFCLLSSLTCGQSRAEPHAVVPVVRVEVVAARRPAADRVADPTAAPKHTVRA